jgi:hypothetical protein
VYRFISRDPLLRPWTVVLVLGDVMWLALFAVLPVLVLERFGNEPAVVGLTFAGFGLGAVAGGVIAFRLVGSIDRVLLASIGRSGWAFRSGSSSCTRPPRCSSSRSSSPASPTAS